MCRLRTVFEIGSRSDFPCRSENGRNVHMKMVTLSDGLSGRLILKKDRSLREGEYLKIEVRGWRLAFRFRRSRLAQKRRRFANSRFSAPLYRFEDFTALRKYPMLKIVDLGCEKHHWRRLSLLAPGAELLKDVLCNLPREGEFHTYICQHGHTHRIIFQAQALKVASCGATRG